jgi:hypothetical protein
MKRRLPFVALIVVLGALLNCGSPAAPTSQSQPKIGIVRLPPEVRLRKLHLVRPDLIPYPLCYEVYC